MAQYTDNLIPAMTGNTTPSGVVASSPIWDVRYPWKAFNHGTTYNMDTDGWTGSGCNSWISYTFPNLTRINKIEIFNIIPAIVEGLDNWSHISAYGDDTNLIATFSRADLSPTAIQTSQYVLYTLEFDNSKNYNKYTLKFDNRNYTYIYEIKMYSKLLGKYLIMKDNEYYSIKDNTLTLLGAPTADIQKEQWFNAYGVNDLKTTLLTLDSSGNKLIDSLDDKFEIRMMVPKS